MSVIVAVSAIAAKRTAAVLLLSKTDAASVIEAA